MALGGNSLGTLTLYINADTSDFDQAIGRIEQKAKSFGTRFSQVEQGLDLTPQVDDSQLTALNKHLNLKQQHFSQVGRFMQQSPLSPKVQTSNLEDLKADLREVLALQRQTAKQFEQNPINLPRITIAPRISNRTVNEAARINTRITAPDLKLTGTVSPKVTVSNRLQNNIKNTTSAAMGASASPRQTIADLRQVENQLQRIEQTEVSPRLDIEAIERFTKRIADLESQVEKLNEKQKKATKEPNATNKALGEAAAKALPNAAEKVADGIGTGISQGLSQAIPAFAGKMGDAAASAIATAVTRTVTPAIKINTPEIKFQTSFTDIVRAGKELAGATNNLKETTKAANKKPNPILSFGSRLVGSVFTGIGQGVGGRISTGIVSGIEGKLDIKFREAAEAAVVVLADGLEDALGVEFKKVGDLVKAQAPAIFEESGQSRPRKKRSDPGTGQPATTIEDAVTFLSDQDDGAVQKDGVGFNKLDTKRGQRLATKIKAGNKLSQEEAKAALQMLQKYRQQLANANKGSLPKWDEIEQQYQQVTQTQVQVSPPQETIQELQVQLDTLQAQLKTATQSGGNTEDVSEQVEAIQKTEAELNQLIAQKKEDLINAMMSSREITMTTLKPLGKNLNLPNLDKSRSEGGYSKDQLIKEIVGQSNPDELKKSLPFIVSPSKDVISEAESRATLAPDALKKRLGDRRASLVKAVSTVPKTSADTTRINNEIQKEQQIITNLLSRDLSNTAKRYLTNQRKSLTKLSDQLVSEAMGEQQQSQNQTPAQQQGTAGSEEIPDPWIDVDQLRSQAGATRSAFEIIGDAIGAFVDGLQGYASKIVDSFKNILGGIGSFFGGGSSSPQQQATEEVQKPSEAPADPNGYNPKNPAEDLPKGVQVKDNEKKKQREYEWATASGKKVKVILKDAQKDESEVSFSIDGSFANKNNMSQKEKDAASLKIFKVLKHDAKTRKNNHRYQGLAYDLDGYGAARAYAYQKVGNFTRPVRGIVGMAQYGITKDGKIKPDEERLKYEERHLSPGYADRNMAKAEARMQKEREQQKQRNQTKTANSSSVDQLRSQAGVAKDALEILSDAIAAFAEQATQLSQKIQDSVGSVFSGDWFKGQQQKPEAPVADQYEQLLAKITEQAAKQSGIKIKPGQQPKLEFNDEHLKRVGARAQYNLKENKLIVSSDVKRFFDALKSGAVNLNRYEQEIKDVVHEIRHAFQYDFGALNQGSLMNGAKPGVMTPFAQTSAASQQYATQEAGSDYYKQFARQMADPAAFLDIIRDTEADAENFAESWKEIIQGAFDIDEEDVRSDAAKAMQMFLKGFAAPLNTQKKTKVGQEFAVAQSRGITGAVATADPRLKQGLDKALEAFNETFDVFKTFQSAVNTVVGSGSSSTTGMLDSIQRSIEDIQAAVEAEANNMSQRGASETVDFLDKLENQLDTEVENVEKFIAYVRRKTGGRANPVLDTVQAKFNNKVAGIKSGIGQARDQAALDAGLVQPQVAAVPPQLNTWQKILRNIREEIEAINNGEDIKVRFARGAAADLGVQLSDEQAEKLTQSSGNALNRARQAPGLIQAAAKGNWKDIFEDLLDEIDEFTDVALDRFADFVEGIPGGNVFARVIRGAKEFKGVIFGFIGLQMAFQGLVQVKQWLDGFDEVFVDAAVGWERFEKLIGFSSKTFNQAQSNIKFVRDEAIRLRTDLKQSMQGFSQLSAASIDTSLEGTGTKQIFKGLNQAGSAFGLDAEGQNRVFTATSQMISKGTVSSEELKQQLGEVLPGSFQMAARAAGKTTQEFTQLLETGQILSEDFLPKFAQQLGAETAVGVAGAASSAQGATNRLNNSLLELQVSLGKFGMDERNIVLNAMASMMDFAAKNAVVLSYAMGSLLAGALITSGQALWIFVKRLVVAGANFLMTRLGITSLGLSIKTLGATIRASASSFLILTVVLETVSMISAAMKDSSGKSREFANTLKGSFKETQRSIAEARGELEKFNAEQDKKDGKKGTGKIVEQGQDSILDEAPLLNWVLKKEVRDNDGWFDKMRFGARKSLAGAADGLGTLFNPGAAIESVKTGDRTLMPTYANKKFQDTKRSTTEILDVSNNSAKASTAALGEKEMQDVKMYDEQLRQIQLKRRGIVQINPGDKKGLNELKRQEESVLANREKAYKPLAGMQATNQISIQALESEIDVYKEKIKEAESSVGTASTRKDKADIQARLDYYKQTLPQLETSLKSVQDAQDNLSKSIGESVDKFVLLQKQLQNVADRLADANDSIQMIGNDAKSQLSGRVASGDVTAGQADFAKGKIDQSILQEQLTRKKGAINEYQGLLYGSDAQAILESRGVKDIKDVGAAQLGTLAAKAKEGTPEKEVFTRLQEMKKLELESSELTAQLETAKEQTAQQIRDANKQINDYFKDIGRQSAELALTTKEAQAQIALQQQKNKLKSALQGFQDNFFSFFVDSLIEGMDLLNEPIQASLEKEREFQSAQYAREDRDRQGADLYKSLPLDTQNIKLDFSAIDSAPVKELQNSLQESAKASKSLSDQSKNTGAALGTSAKQADTLEANVAGAQGKAKEVATAVQAGKGALSDSAQEAGNLKDNVEGVADRADGVRQSADGVTSALQNNVTEAQNVNTEIANNQVGIEGNQMAVENVNAVIGEQTLKVNESALATQEAQVATGLVQTAWSLVTGGVGDTIARTYELFKGLANNVPFLNQFSGIFASWEGFIQNLIGKTWEWIKGLADNLPFLNQIGETVSGWGQNIGNMAQQGASNVQQTLTGTGGTFASGLYTGDSPYIGGSAAYHIDSKISKSIGKEMAIKLIDQMAEGYEAQGRQMMFSNSAVAGKVWNRGWSNEEKFSMLEKIDAAHSHSPNPSLWDFDYYVPKKGEDMHGKSTEGAEFLLPNVGGAKVEYASGGGYGNYATMTDAQGNLIMKTGHGDNRKALPQNRTLSSPNAVQKAIGATGNAIAGAATAAGNWMSDRVEDTKRAFGMGGGATTATGGVGGSLGGRGAGMLGQMGSPAQTKPTGGRDYRKLSREENIQSIVNEAVKAGVKDKAQISYIVATALHETGGFQFFQEQGSRDYFRKYAPGTELGIDLGNTQQDDDYRFRGHGFTQLTGRRNFEKQSRRMGMDLVNNPTLLADPSVSANVLVDGILKGDFTGRKLGDYIGGGKVDISNARRTINGYDQDQVNQVNAEYNKIAPQIDKYIANAGKGGSPVSMPSGAPQAQAAPRPMIAPVPFASMQKQMSVSGTSVDTSKLSAAEQKSAEMQRQQQANALKKEQARVEEARVQGEQRQRQRLEQLRQSLRETTQDRVQSNRQFRDLGLDIGEQTPEREAARKKMGISDTYDDLEKEIAEKVRKATAARDQASATLQKLSAPDYVPQPGQNVQKDIEGTKAAIAAAEGYIADLSKIQGELKGQRESRLKFEEEQAAREKKLREQQETFATEEVSISVLEAESQRLQGMKERGIRDQGVENLPKIEASIAARREELSLKQKLSEIDENLRKNKDNPAIVSELNKQKAGLQDRLGIVKKTIDANRTYSEEVMRRENAQRSREAANAQGQAELEIQKQRLAGLQELARLNPSAEGVDMIPKLEETIALKELELKVTNDLAAADQERFENKINPQQYAERVKAIQDENKLAKENVYLKRRQAEAEAAIARKRTAFETKSQSSELQGQVTEALVRNIEFGRRQGDPVAMRFDSQKQQQELSFERQMLELEELEMSGKRTKEEIDSLRKAYTQLNEISLENLASEQQRATEDRLMEVSGRFTQSRGAVLGGRADLMGSLGLDTQAKEYRKVSAVKEQQQSYSQQSLELERFIQQMGLGAEKALELRTNLSEVNNMSLERINNEFSTMNEVVGGVQNSFESAFASVLDGSKTIGEAALDFLKGIGSQLAQMASKMITDEIFGKIMGKGNKDAAKKEAGLIGDGGVLGSLMGGKDNPLGQFSMMNPLPVVMTNAGSLGGFGQAAGAGLGSSGSFIDGIFGGQGGFFGENLFGSSPLPVNMVQANDSIFSSLTSGIIGIFGGGGGLSGLLGGALSLFGGGGGSGGAGGGLGFLSAIPNLLGIFAEGGEVGDAKLHAQISQGLRQESAMTGRKSRLIIASDGELVVPHKVVAKLSGQEKAILTGRQLPPSTSIPAYANGGIVGNMMGGAIASNVTNMGGSTSIGGSTVNVNGEGGGSMTQQEAKAMQAMIDQRVMEVVAKQTRPRGLLAR